MNTWDNIKAAQIAHDLIHWESNNGKIADFDPSCIYCAGDSRRLEVLIQESKKETNKKIAKSARQNAEEILKQ